MKSSMTQATHGGMNLIARFHPDSDRDKLWQMKNNYKHMKSSMTKIVAHWDDKNTCEIPSDN
jgi:hypothetical protein